MARDRERPTTDILRVPPAGNGRTVTASVRMSFYVQPRAARTEIVGYHGGDLKIRLAAPPLENAANLELIAFIARQLRLPKRNIRLTAGRTGRRKSVAIEGASAAAMAMLHAAALAAKAAHDAVGSHAKQPAVRSKR